MSYLRLLVALPVVGSALVLACGGSDGDGNAQGALSAPVAEADFYPRFVKAMCTDIGPCCANDGNPFTAGTCESVLNGMAADAGSAQVGGSFLDTLLKQHGLTYDPQAGGDCIDGIAALQRACSAAPVTELDNIFSAFGSTKLLACYSVFKGGTKKPGETCAESYECAIPAGGAGGCVPAKDDPNRMTCSTFVRAKRGEACTPIEDQGTVAEARLCELDGILDGAKDATKLNRCDPATRTCAPYPFVDEGAACDEKAGTFCRPPSECTSGKCVVRPVTGAPVGAPCKDDDECVTHACNRASVCASAFSGISASALCGR